MKTALLVLAAVLPALLLLCAAFIRIKIDLSDEGQIVIRYLFLRFRFDLYPAKPSADKKQKKTAKDKKKSKKEKKQTGNFLQNLVREKGAVDAVTTVLQLVSRLLSRIGRLFSHCTLDRFCFSAEIGEGDPAKTAMTYGTLCTVVYPVVGVINGTLPIKKQEVSLNACYDEERLDIRFSAVVRVRLLHVVSAVCKILKDLVQFKTAA